MNNFLNNKSLEKFIKEAPLIDESQKKDFLGILPYLDEKERMDLIKTLKEIILLNREKEELIEEIGERGKE